MFDKKIINMNWTIFDIRKYHTRKNCNEIAFNKMNERITMNNA